MLTGVCMSSSGDVLVTCSWKTAILWDMKTGKKIRTFEGHTEPVTGVCMSSSGDVLVTCSADKTAILWDMKTGKKIKLLIISGSNEELFVSHVQLLMSTNGYIFSVDDKYNVRLCITDIADAEEYNDALQFNERVDRPDLILSKVSSCSH